MSLRRYAGFLLTRRFSPRATPRTAPARSLHSLRDLPIADGLPGAASVAAAALAGAGTLVIQYFRKGPDDDDESGRFLLPELRFMSGTTDSYLSCCAAAQKEEDMKARFNDWVNKNNKTYRDEVEMVARFQVFKDTIKWIESQPLSTQKKLLPELSYFADYTVQERRSMTLGPDAKNTKELQDEMKQSRAMREKGELSQRKRAMKQGDTRPSILLTCNFCTKKEELSRAVKQGDTGPKVSA